MPVAEPTAESGLWPRVKAITGWPQPDESRIAELATAWRSGGRLFTEAGDLATVNESAQLWPDAAGDAFVAQATGTLQAAALAGEDMARVADRTEAFGLEVTAVKNGIVQTIEDNVVAFELIGLLPGGAREAFQGWFVDQVAGYVNALIAESAARIQGWSTAGSDALVQPTWDEELGRQLGTLGADAVNGALSVGNAALQNPLAVGGLVLGGGLAAVSASGVVAGGAATLTGAGAVAGVPLSSLSTAGVLTGAGIAGTALAAIAEDAAGDAAVEAVPRPQQATPTDRIKEHLTERDLDAARRELDGEVVARRSDGTPYDHVHEVRDAQRGLLNRIGALRRTLGDSRSTPAERGAAQEELSEASRLLDHSEGYVPR